ncbi:MAG TPA: sugar phosphate isomerase/epimerase family protein [Cytophagales bacterium]
MSINLLMNLLLWTTEMDDDMAPVVEELKQTGFDGVEVPVFGTDLAKWERWGRRLDDLGLARTAVTFCGADDNPIGPSRAVRQRAVDRLKRLADGSHALGATILSGPIHSALNVFTGSPATAQEWDWAVEGVRQVAQHAAGGGVTLGIEYLNRFENYLLTSTEETLRFVRDVGHPGCRVMFDTFHANIEEKNIADAFRRCAAEVVHIQVSENDRSTPGRGHIPWTAFFDALRETGYAGSLSIEAFGRRQPDLAAATKIWRRMFESEAQLSRDGLAFLRRETRRK